MWNLTATGSPTNVTAFINAYAPDLTDLGNYRAARVYLLGLIAQYNVAGIEVAVVAIGDNSGPVPAISISVKPIYVVGSMVAHKPEPAAKAATAGA